MRLKTLFLVLFMQRVHFSRKSTSYVAELLFGQYGSSAGLPYSFMGMGRS